MANKYDCTFLGLPIGFQEIFPNFEREIGWLIGFMSKNISAKCF
jgi:hypothetical protein